jgi:hypothetical protein
VPFEVKVLLALAKGASSSGANPQPKTKFKCCTFRTADSLNYWPLIVSWEASVPGSAVGPPDGRAGGSRDYS